jgi:hypothetical protein
MIVATDSELSASGSDSSYDSSTESEANNEMVDEKKAGPAKLEPKEVLPKMLAEIVAQIPDDFSIKAAREFIANCGDGINVEVIFPNDHFDRYFISFFNCLKYNS